MLLYIAGVLADEILLDVLERTEKRLFLIFESSLTDSPLAIVFNSKEI